MTTLPLIVLDRDGVINHDSKDFIKSPDEWVPLPGSLEAIARITQGGYRVVIATNQSGVGRKLFDRSMLNKIHAKMTSSIEKTGGSISKIFICPHHPDDGCDCRKPLPGLFAQIARHYSMLPAQMIAVGDSLRDLEAALACGSKAVLVRTGNGLATERSGQHLSNIEVYDDLAGFSKALVGQSGHRS